MADAKTITIKDKKLKCLHCGKDKFYEVNVKLNTVHTTYFGGLAAAFAKKAKAYICSNCGRKEEFVKEK